MPKKSVKKTTITEEIVEPKDTTKKKIVKKSKRKKPAIHRVKHGKLETHLIENLIELQKLHVKLGEKFDNLTEQISTLLALFEMSARSFAINPDIKMAEKDKEFLEKIDRLLDQNKTIAKGLTLMDQKMREKLYGPVLNPVRIENKNPRPPKF